MRVFVIAGEPSGDALGQAVMAGLKALVPGVSFDGVGGPGMQSEGLVSRFDMQELSVMGIAEVLPKYFHLKRRIRELAHAVVNTRPDFLLTIDSPDFCLRVAKRVKASSTVRTIHYVSPSVWAWRPKRADKMAKFIDQVLAVLPFEPPHLERAGIACDFVGHPVAMTPQASPEDLGAFRLRYGIEAETPVLLVLPGSRKGEIRRMAPVFGETVTQLARVQPELQVLTVAAKGVADLVRAAAKDWDVPAHVVESEVVAEKRAAFAAADVALAASGTVSLELAAAGTPMVIAYKMNPISFQIIKSMALIDTVTLVNIITKRREVPEFLGPDCRPEALAPAVLGLVDAPEAQATALRETMVAIGKGGEAPGIRAAKAILKRL